MFGARSGAYAIIVCSLFETMLSFSWILELEFKIKSNMLIKY